MIQESDLVPFNVSLPIGNRVLILSPHPDDESLGCGGTIRLLLLRKTPVKVIFLTSGEKADPSHRLSQIIHYENPPTDPSEKGGGRGFEEAQGGLSVESHITGYSLLREKEALKALSVLGVSDYEFFRFSDRELNGHFDNALERLMRDVETYMPDAIYSPSVIELNPDHRATAALSLEIQRRMADRIPIKLLFYEVTTPLRPNMLVDITRVYSSKKRAIQKYRSQMRIRNYLKYITGLNEFRSLTLSGTKHAEAFWYMDKPLSEEDMAKWLSYQQKIPGQS
jgi:LmbE family N-acetylglucosaminyl deacetylase